MTSALRFPIVLAVLASLAACSPSSSRPGLSDDLQRDLAKAAAGDVQLAGAHAPRIDVVSALEAGRAPTPAPRAPSVARVASARRGRAAAVKSTRRRALSVPVESKVAAPRAAVPTAPREVAPTPVPAPDRAVPAPLPSTQREPRGGWSTPGRIIRNAPFPINPGRGVGTE